VWHGVAWAALGWNGVAWGAHWQEDQRLSNGKKRAKYERREWGKPGRARACPFIPEHGSQFNWHWSDKALTFFPCPHQNIATKIPSPTPSGSESDYLNSGEFHDQGDAKWIVIRKSLWHS
jgi:hypothetical protein